MRLVMESSLRSWLLLAAWCRAAALPDTPCEVHGVGAFGGRTAQDSRADAVLDSGLCASDACDDARRSSIDVAGLGQVTGPAAGEPRDNFPRKVHKHGLAEGRETEGGRQR